MNVKIKKEKRNEKVSMVRELDQNIQGHLKGEKGTVLLITISNWLASKQIV